MLEEIGISNDELSVFMEAFNELGDKIQDKNSNITEDEFYLAFAKLPIETVKLKKLGVNIRSKASLFIADFFRDVFLTNPPKSKSSLISKLHTSDDDAFLDILKRVKQALMEMVPEDKKNELKEFSIERLALLFNTEVKRYICLATACILSDIPNAAYANINMALTKLAQSLKLFEATDHVIQKEGEIKRAKDASKKSNLKRHAKSNLVRDYAISLYEQGKFSSVRNASQRIAHKVMDYAHNDIALRKMEGTDKRFTDVFAAADTIERWIGKHKKVLETTKS
jgi:hypothetical protein